MRRGLSTIRLYLLDDRAVDLDHVALIVDRLGSIRDVEEDPPGWRVIYETGDLSEAMAICAADLDALDPHWLSLFDFSASRAPGRRS